ncbi:hypothetical protein GCM10027566_08930 [Arachidicoccus ginsenosidivorans]|jgi:AraC-like DNA-binding protein|uniref:Helix-turn-helix transcriptional regulator n=1 Tax=Arachidicoccus ginsenosidivorans TaxID=496057 RepID=A0A5B8VT37_9BACT|nr:AraC family transcriptional regulator [Arachidicoccus ginsenosidivorans]QEC73765.1 helix-turn-helix transcriptional regulator [Arachidicoccus ginsenosidivorans]
MNELFGFKADKFQYFDWQDSPYKGYNGIILPDAKVASLSGGFGNMLFQGILSPVASYGNIWKSDYDIVEDFTGHASLDYRSIEVSLVLKSNIAHFHPSSGWKICKENYINLTHTMAMDNKTKFEKNVHYQSYDCHLNPIIFDQLMLFMPELVSPFLNDYNAGREISLFEGGMNPNSAIYYIAHQIITSTNNGGSEALNNINLLLLVAQIFLAKAEMVQRRGARPEHKEALNTINGIKNLLITDQLAFHGINHYAKIAHMSNTNFKKHFKQQTGLSTFQFMQDEKLKQAIVKLLNTKESITSISRDLGYSDHRALGKAFKKQFGMSPKTFRNNNKC